MEARGVAQWAEQLYETKDQVDIEVKEDGAVTPNEVALDSCGEEDEDLMEDKEAKEAVEEMIRRAAGKMVPRVVALGNQPQMICADLNVDPCKS